MPSTPQHDDVFKNVAKLIASRGQGQTGGNGLLFPTPGAQVDIKPIKQPEREQGWNLGQGIIDTLSSGSYAVAGIGQKIGEAVQAAQAGDIGQAIASGNPFGLLAGIGEGVSNRRTWSENLADWGMEQGTAANGSPLAPRDAVGLVLDIALDPFWLIPGGAIATGLKATTKGVGISSAATKSGVQLTGKGFEGAKAAVAGTRQPYVTRNIGMTPEGITVPQNLQEFFPQGAKSLKPNALSNLIQGVKQTNADEYAAWSAARAAKKAAKKGDITTPVSAPTVIDPTGEAGIKAAAVIGADATKTIENLAEGPAEQAASTIIDVSKAVDSVDNVVKEVEAARGTETAADKVDQVTNNPSIYSIAREKLSPVRDEYLTTRSISAPEIDFKKVEVSPKAVEMAKVYDNLVSAPNDPEVIKGYSRFIKEVEDQYDFLVNEKGLQVEFIDGDPYNVPKPGGAAGETVPDSRLMMQDIVDNNHLYVRGSAQDFAEFPHPLLTVEQNNKFRAVHDYFGHAASGRGVLADGEEAAWMAHSTMFSPLARRAMTTETRGQNSYYNFFNPDRKEFAPQKAALFPEEYTLLPEEISTIERFHDGSSLLRGASLSAIESANDVLLPTLSRVASKLNTLEYSKEELDTIFAQYEELVGTVKVDATDPVSGYVGDLFDKFAELIAKPTATRLEGLGLKEAYYDASGNMSLDPVNTIMGIIRTAEKAQGVKFFEKQGGKGKSLAILHQMFDEPIDATDLLESALRDEGRLGVLMEKKPFKATRWDVDFKASVPTKPAFTTEKLAKYFPDDQLLANPEDLALAMGEVKVRPGTKRAAALAEKQARLWEQFRARNHDYMNVVANKERDEWLAANSIPASELFRVLPDGTVLGEGMLPASIPKGTIKMLNGRPVTTLGAVISKLSTVVRETGGQGLPGFRLTGSTVAIEGAGVRVPFPKEPSVTELLRWRVNTPNITKADKGSEQRMLRMLSEEDQNLYAEVLLDPERKARYVVEDLRGEDLSGLSQEMSAARMTIKGKVTRPETYEIDKQKRIVGINFKTAEAKAVAKRLAARGREIELDRYPVPLQGWLVSKLDELAKSARKSGVIDRRGKIERSVDDIADQLFNLPGSKLKSMADARLMASLGKEAITKLAKAPARRYFVNAPGMPMSREAIGTIPDYSFVTKKLDTATGDYKLQNADFAADKRPMTAAVGKKGQYKYASQTTATGKDQLASVAIARDAIGAISEKITAGEFMASPEQAKLLGQILQDLSIAVAPNASPRKIFETFAKQAPKRYEDLIQGLESAAKTDSLVAQMRRTFAQASYDKSSILEAAAKLDAADTQAKISGWTQQTLSRIDEICTRYGSPEPGLLAIDIPGLLARTQG